MLDIILASLIARSFGNRAKMRGKSRAGTGIVVFLTIIGTEVGVGVWMAGPTFVRATLLAGLVLGWFIGVCLGSAIGALLTRGPIVQGLAGDVPECFECQKEIIDEVGVPCGGCKHTLHRRCLSEHARAHRAYERARRGGPGAAVEADPAKSVPPEALPAEPRRDDTTSSGPGPSSSDSLAGIECVQCQREIVMRHQGARCETCGEPLHRACEGPHRATHLGPFRRAASGS